MIGIEGTSAKAALPQVANNAPHAIHALCVLAVHGLQRPLKAVLLDGIATVWTWFGIRQYAKMASRRGAHNPREDRDRPGVAGREKHRFAMIAALGGVVRDAWKTIRVTWHTWKVCRQLRWRASDC
jgi:hypothetical protein